MTPTVQVRCVEAGAGWSCEVHVDDGRGARTTHVVGVSHADLARLAPGAERPDDLVARSFAFLLEREPAGSILARFDLPVIGRYFPEYESTIRR